MVFVLRPNCRTPAHFHPNSVQFTVVVEGNGRIKIGDVEKEVEVFDKDTHSPVWYVIGGRGFAFGFY